MNAKRLVPLLSVISALVLASSAQAAGGSVAGWGDNGYAQVTAPAGGTLTAPTPVSGIATATDVAAGYYHTVALLSDGTVMAWGTNYEGQLGIGDITGPEICGAYSCSRKPVPVPGIAGAIAVAAGTYHSLALLSNGTVMAWGENVYGQLGLGTSTGPELCNTYACSAKPVLIPGLSNVVAIATGYDASLALLADGTVVGWGENPYGQLGFGEGTGPETCGKEEPCSRRPLPVPGVSNAVAIAMGEYGASALLGDGTELSWGRNEYGELGNGAPTVNGCNCLGPVPVAGLTGAKAIAVADYHRVALLGDGTARAWGYNYEGEVGSGTKSQTGCYCVLAPTPVFGLSSAQAIDGGGYFNLALLADGTVRSWGEGPSGQLGDGAITERSVPGPVGTLAGVSDIVAGEETGFAVIGPSQTLTVVVAGAGSGTVGAQGIVCPVSNCSANFPQGQVENLRAAPTSGGFAGFSGPCTGTGTCQVKMDTDQTVTATFGVPKGTAITKSDVNSKKKKATFTFSAPGAITGYECRLIKPKPKKRKGKGRKHRVVLAKKGKKPKPPAFSPCTGPAAYRSLRPGKYSFEVRALDILGADATPAMKKFQVKKPKPKKHRKGK